MPLLPLETFREILGFMPWHFWQLASPPGDNEIVPLDGGCNTLVREYAWQFQDGAGRKEIRQAISAAEQRLVEHLGFSVAPHWVCETQDVSCFQSGTPTLISLKEGRVRQIGQMSWSLIQSVPIVFNDTDGDGLIDTFEATVTMPSGVTVDKLGLFFLEEDRSLSDRDWQILPVTLSQSGNDLIIRGRAWLLVKPTLYEGYWYRPGYQHGQVGRDSSGALDPTVEDNYVHSVGLYKQVVSNANIVTLTYHNSDGTATDYTLPATICNAETGLVSLQADCIGLPPDCYCGGYYPYDCPPRSITVCYQAGATLADWQLIVARLAAAELMRKICGCDAANQELYNWMADSADPDSKFKPAQDEMSSPFGTKKGAIYAWKQVKNLRLLRGMAF